MFSNAMIGFFAAVGAAAWVYTRMQRQTGGNTQNSLVVAGGAGLLIFLAITTFLTIML